MKPESILQADLLDILFMNRNKAYGAYALRRDYNNRMCKALAVTFSIAFLLSASWYISNKYFKSAMHAPIFVIDGSRLMDLQPETKPPTKAVARLKQVTATAKSTTPLIVPDDKADKITPNEQLDNKVIGTATVAGVPADGPVEPPAAPARTGGKEGETIDKPAPVEDKPFVLAEVMPEFPGGMEALRKYLLRHLKEPEDLSPGEKLVVVVRFVVGIDGTIDDVQVLRSGGRFDTQVLQVVKKMPQWKPGMQNKRFVPVYFTLPVTFVGPEE